MNAVASQLISFPWRDALMALGDDTWECRNSGQSGGVTIFRVAAHNKWKEIPAIKKWYKKAVKCMNGQYKAEDVEDLVYSGACDLWLAKKGDRTVFFVLTDTIRYPRLSALRLLFMAGESAEYMKFFQAPFVEWAQRIGAKNIEVVARPGLKRIGAQLGYKVYSYLMSCDV